MKDPSDRKQGTPSKAYSLYAIACNTADLVKELRKFNKSERSFNERVDEP